MFVIPDRLKKGLSGTVWFLFVFPVAEEGFLGNSSLNPASSYHCSCDIEFPDICPVCGEGEPDSFFEIHRSCTPRGSSFLSGLRVCSPLVYKVPCCRRHIGSAQSSLILGIRDGSVHLLVRKREYAEALMAANGDVDCKLVSGREYLKVLLSLKKGSLFFIFIVFFLLVPLMFALSF